MVRLRYDRRPLFMVAVFLGAAFVMAGWFFHGLALRRQTMEEKALHLVEAGRNSDAEAAYVELFRSGGLIGTDTVIAFLDNHAQVMVHERLKSGMFETPGPVLPESEVRRLLIGRGVTEDAAFLGDFYFSALLGRVADTLFNEVRAYADSDPPVPWANRVIGRYYAMNGENQKAAPFFIREGCAFDERREDVDHGLALLMSESDLEEVSRLLAKPEVASRASAPFRYAHAVRVKDWRGALLALVPSMGAHLRWNTGILSAFAGSYESPSGSWLEKLRATWFCCHVFAALGWIGDLPG